MQRHQSLNVGLVFDDSLDSNDGVAQYVKTVGAWLSGRGHHVSYLVGETKLREWAGGKVHSMAKNQTVYFNGNKLSMPLLASQQNIQKVLSENKYDVLHVMVPYSPLMAKRVIKTADPKTAIVGTFHILPSGFISKLGSRFLAAWLRRSLKRFDAQFSASSAAAQFAQISYGINSIVIPNTVEIKRFKVSKAEPNTVPTILFLGRLVKRKGAAELIKAFALLKQRQPNLRLKIASDGPDRAKLEALVDKLNVRDDTEFLGFIDEKDKPRLLSEADIACFPSLYGECFGIVLIEAMAAGSKVVLGGNNPGYRSVLSEQPQMLINPLDTIAFADRLELLLKDKDLVSNLHAWQDKTVRQYDINVVGEALETQYLEAIARRHKKDNNKSK
jgi:phosphatidylinositol alpha-mannosyltransferase